MDEALLAKIGDVERDHWWFVMRRAIVLQAIEALGLPEDARIVEIGCGTGSMLAEMRSWHPRWWCLGVEPNASACYVTRRLGCRVVQGALFDLPLPDASAECLVALDVLEHCADDVAASAEMSRVLTGDGHLVLTVPALPSPWSVRDIDNAHFRRYTRRTLSSTLECAGFVIDRITYFNGLLSPLDYAFRLVSRVTYSRKPIGLDLPRRPMNATPRAIFGLETIGFRCSSLPVGMSLLTVARKELCK